MSESVAIDVETELKLVDGAGKKSKKEKKQKKEKAATNEPELTKIDNSDELEIEQSYSQKLRKKLGQGESSFVKNLKEGTNPVDLSWKNLSVEVVERKKFKKHKKVILNNVSGHALSGQVLAILGSSGAGKTTLLNALSDRVSGNISGEMVVNGQKLTSATRRSLSYMSGYVMQDDVLLPNLTVRETLLYAAYLRLPNTYTIKQKQQKVDELIEELGLTKAKNTMIGSALKRGISGGERKRVNIACELITDPSLIFLDEPTSGLDSFTALNIMETLLAVAKSGRTVVCTIHQPRSNIYALFDKLMILAKGEVVYFGTAAKAVDYFSNLKYPCPAYANPADYLLDVASIDTRNEKIQTETTTIVDTLITSYKESPTFKKEKKFLKKLGKSETQEPIPPNISFATGIPTQFRWLFHRSFKNFYRDKVLNFIRLFQTLLFAIVIGLIYLRIGNDQQTIQDRVGALFFILINQAFGGLFGVINTFPDEKAVFMRERASRMYRVFPYYMTRSAAEFPGQILFPIIFATISYWMIGFQADAGKFFLFVLIIVLATFTVQSIGLALSAAAPSAQFANILAPVILVILLLFGGFYINTDNIPKYFIWIEWISFVKYAFNGLMKNEFSGLTFTCTDAQLVKVPGADPVCPVTTGNQVLSTFALLDDKLEIWVNIVVLAGMIVFFRILGYLALRFLSKKRA